MITNAAIEVYREFNGDPGGLARSGTSAQRDLLPDREWGLLADVLHDLYLVQQGLASASYAAQVKRRLRVHCGDRQVLAALTGLAQSAGGAHF